MMQAKPPRLQRVGRKLQLSLSVFGRIRLHPLFILLFVFAIGVGLWREMAVLFLLVMLHELGHAAAANHLGYQVEQVSLLPFGGVAKLAYGSLGFRPQHEALIAAAGPFVNLLLAVGAWLVYALGAWSAEFYHMVVQLNLWIAVFNLLPGLPLDGGRVLRAARSRKLGFAEATREAYNVALFISVVLLALGACALWAGYPHFGMLVLGVFLCVSAWTGRRDLSMETVRFLDSKRRRGRPKPEEVRAFAAKSTSSIKDIVTQFAPDRYHMVYVLDSLGAVRTILEEDELLEAVFAGRWMDSIEVWLTRE
jgi:stage IV sporulation protein FB